jgi:hypothetical protein
MPIFRFQNSSTFRSLVLFSDPSYPVFKYYHSPSCLILLYHSMLNNVMDTVCNRTKNYHRYIPCSNRPHASYKAARSNLVSTCSAESETCRGMQLGDVCSDVKLVGCRTITVTTEVVVVVVVVIVVVVVSVLAERDVSVTRGCSVSTFKKSSP